MDLAGHFAGAVVEEEVLPQKVGELQHLLVPLPARQLPDEVGVDVGERPRLAAQLPAQPADRRLLVVDEEVGLVQVPRPHPPAVVVGDLFGEEVHVVALREALGQPRVELRRREGDRHAALDVEGDHAVVEEVARAFDDRLGEAVAGDEDGEPAEVAPHEVPCALLAASAKAESLFEGLLGLVRRDHQVLLHGTLGQHLVEGPLLLV